MILRECPANVQALVIQYVERLALPADALQVTTDRRVFGRWIGRTSIPARIGGAYAFNSRTNRHCVLIHLGRIDRARPRAVEIVVAEELIHMRDRLDGDLRGHARHGHDRIAHRVADLVGVTLEEIRSVLIPPRRRPFKYVYACPACSRLIPRARAGEWDCRACWERSGQRIRLLKSGPLAEITGPG